MATHSQTPPPTKAFAFYAAELRKRAFEAESRAEFLADYKHARCCSSCGSSMQRLRLQEVSYPKLQGESLEEGEEDEKEEDPEEEEEEEEAIAEGMQEEEEQKQEDAVPADDPKEKTKKMAKLAPKPSQANP